MSITISTNTKARATLKLYNQLNYYMFEQEYDELRYDNDVEGIRTVKYSKEQVVYYITNNL